MSTQTQMSAERFAELAEAFGADLDRWPVEDRALAVAFRETHPDQAQQVLQAAADLDALLALDRPIRPEPALYESIVASGLRQVSGPPRWAGIAAAIALMFGAGAGWLGAEPRKPDAEALLYASAFSVLSEADGLFEDAS